MSARTSYSEPIMAGELRDALRELRDDAHYDYMLSSERKSERAYERVQFCEKLALLLRLDLGPVDR